MVIDKKCHYLHFIIYYPIRRKLLELGPTDFCKLIPHTVRGTCVLLNVIVVHLLSVPFRCPNYGIAERQ